MELSVVAEIVPVDVPPVDVKATVDPPVDNKLLLESRAVKVRVTVEPEFTVPADTLTVEFARLMGPAVTVTVGRVLVTETPPMVPVMVVAVPATTPVKVAE